jgi:hypothetical protein
VQVALNKGKTLFFFADKSNRSMETDLKISKEIDPHFFLNSFTTLGYLIHTDANKAYRFNSMMAQVYQYFLLNKKKTLVAADDEITFIENYCYLLKVRHEEKLQVNIKREWAGAGQLLVVPFVLQVLIDHSIKSNHFSGEDPLVLDIVLKARSVAFSQNRSPRTTESFSPPFISTIDAHYSLCTGKGIAPESGPSGYSISLPLIHST